MGVSTSNHGRTPGDPERVTTIQTTIGSDFSAGREVQRQILASVEKHHFDTQSAFAIKLALEEALINAIKHGNRLDPSKSVHVRARVTDKLAEIIIEDQGPGFDRTCVPDPTAEENLDKCSGRGILLMEAYMSSVEYSNCGRCVRMIKQNGNDAEA
jgi:serine/threonine-protein kinase RsbW